MSGGFYDTGDVLSPWALRHGADMPRRRSIENIPPNGLRRARQALNDGNGISLEKAEELSGIPWRTLQKYETGKRAVPLDQLQVLADAYRMRASDLVEEEPTLRDDEQRLLALYNKLSPADRRRALVILGGLTTA